MRGQEILYHEWIGVIKTVTHNVWFQFDSGATLFLNKIENDGFERIDPYWGPGTTCPGIRTYLSSAALKQATWLTGWIRYFVKWVPALASLWSMTPVTITRTEVGSLS